MNLRQVRKKIKTIGNVKKITKAMQLVSAVKMKKAQQKALEAKPYQESLEEVISKILSKTSASSSLLQSGDEKNKGGRELAIIVTTNKGLCGSFNFNLLRFIIKDNYSKNCDFVTVGKKGVSIVSKLGGGILADFSGGSHVDSISAIFALVVGDFLNRKYNRVNLYYNQFISVLRSEPTKEVLLPVIVKTSEILYPESSGYLVEPSEESIIDNLLRSYAEERLRYALIQSEAGEHSARMIAMKNATDNASDIVDNLTLLGNKLRQEKITYELLDMIAAKESVGN